MVVTALIRWRWILCNVGDGNDNIDNNEDKKEYGDEDDDTTKNDNDSIKSFEILNAC